MTDDLTAAAFALAAEDLGPADVALLVEHLSIVEQGLAHEGKPASAKMVSLAAALLTLSPPPQPATVTVTGRTFPDPPPRTVTVNADDLGQVLSDAQCYEYHDDRTVGRLTAALAGASAPSAPGTVTLGEQPHLLRHEGMGNYTCRVDGTPTGGWPCPNGPDRVPMDPATGMPSEVGEQP